MFSFSLAGGKERRENVQMEGTPSAPLSDNGEKAEPITAEHKGQTDRRGMCKKNTRSYGVCEDCSIHRSDQDQFIKAV